MSILKNKRTLSPLEYERRYMELYDYMTDRLSRLPRRYQAILGSPMREGLSHIYDEVVSISDMYVEGSKAAERKKLKKEAEKHGLILNPRKTRIVRFKDGFTFLKVRYRADGYKTIRTIAKSSAVRQRRKLKKFGPKLCAGAMTQEDVKASMTSWEASTRGTRSFRRIRAMRKKYRAVLKEYKNEIL